MPIEAWDDRFEQFYEVNVDRVARAVRQRAGADAYDIAQDAFLVAHKRWVEVEALERPASWVTRVALRMAARRARRERDRARVEAAGQPDGSTSPPDLDLVGAILGLPDRHAVAVRLHHLEDRPVAELAERLGCSEGAAKVVLHRARRILAERLVGINGQWVSQRTWTADQITRYLVEVGWESHIDAVLDDDFGGRGGRFGLSVKDGYYELRRDDGRRFDHGRCRVDGRTFAMAPILNTGRGTYKLDVDGRRLSLSLLEATSPPTRGVPDAIWQQFYFGSAPFLRSEAGL